MPRMDSTSRVMHGLNMMIMFLVVATVTVGSSRKYCMAHFSRWEGVLKDLYNISKIQLGQYKDVCKREKEAKVNKVAALTKLKEDMEKYEKSKCGLPPGAKGKEGSGCSQH
jgi:hypothetical protein